MDASLTAVDCWGRAGGWGCLPSWGSDPSTEPRAWSDSSRGQGPGARGPGSWGGSGEGSTGRRLRPAGWGLGWGPSPGHGGPHPTRLCLPPTCRLGSELPPGHVLHRWEALAGSFHPRWPWLHCPQQPPWRARPLPWAVPPHPEPLCEPSVPASSWRASWRTRGSVSGDLRHPGSTGPAPAGAPPGAGCAEAVRGRADHEARPGVSAAGPALTCGPGPGFSCSQRAGCVARGAALPLVTGQTQPCRPSRALPARPAAQGGTGPPV